MKEVDITTMGQLRNAAKRANMNVRPFARKHGVSVDALKTRGNRKRSPATVARIRAEKHAPRKGNPRKPG